MINLPGDLVRKYEEVFLLRNLLQDPRLFEDELELERARAKSQLLALDEPVHPVEVYATEAFTTERIEEILRNDIRPIVVRGFASEHDCVKLWTPALFKREYGDFQVWYSSTEQLVNSGLSLSECIDNTLSGQMNRAYIENLSDIFNRYPELYHQVGIEHLEDTLGDTAGFHKIVQLFIGGPGTGAAYHCANELNCFLNIYGRKKWTLVHPKYSAAMYSSIFNNGIFVGSFVKHNAPVRYLEATFPLYNRVPRVEVVLEPGDMLINPPWWWHAINNLGDATIAVASRWEIRVDYQRQNPLYDLVQSMREVRLGLEGKRLEPTNVVVPDSELRHKYVSYEAMGWRNA